MPAGTMLRKFPGRDDRGKRPICWIEDERGAIIRRALELRMNDPTLAGLPLLRKAIHVLPPDRRRNNIRTLSQVPWFEEGLKAELRRRELAEAEARRRAASTEDPLPVLHGIRQADEAAADLLGELLEVHKKTHTLLEHLIGKFAG